LIFGVWASLYLATCKAPVSNQGTFRIISVPAPALAGNRLADSTAQNIGVYLPPQYQNHQQRFPVVYYLGGYGDRVANYSSGAYQGFDLQIAMDSLIVTRIVQEMIIVVISGRNRLFGSFYVNSPVSGNWEDFVVKDVVDYIDGHYRTIAQPESRGIAGHSMGGFGALNLAMRYPDRFAAVYSLSPGLFDSLGIMDSPMFESKEIIKDFIHLQQRLWFVDPDTSLLALVHELQHGDDWRLVFTAAYGMAFAPNLTKPMPHLDYPYFYQDGKLIRDDRIWRQWEDGFGGIVERICRYRGNLLQLRGIVVDVGLRDEYPWIVAGCHYFHEQLNAAEIPNELVIFEGAHDEHLRERIEAKMLPFFSRILSH
jgi:pimeloyl-ACP methyl ester carboxylesterase